MKKMRSVQRAAEGSFVDGKAQGHWVFRYANGKEEEGPYVNGKMEGHWVTRDADGTVWEGPYVNPIVA